MTKAQKQQFKDLLAAADIYEKNGMPQKSCKCLEEMFGLDYKSAYPYLVSYRDRWQQYAQEKKKSDIYYPLVRKLYIVAARRYFEDYLIAVEFDVPYKNKFYLPRREYLRRIGLVQGYQAVLDKKCDLLTVSLPKRCGKSQSEINFVCMLSGMFPMRSSLIEGAGDNLVDSFYKGCLEYIAMKDKYAFCEIFPDAKITDRHADIHTIDLYAKSRFPTITCRSISAAQVGLTEATNVLCLDDCVESREAARNRSGLDKLWENINGDVIGRALEGTPIVATGTRYSLYDPIGKLQENFDRRGKKRISIEVPALDPVTDLSNYEFYDPKLERKLFTTEFFRDQRDALSAEQWMSEFQQQPFEAKGLLFPTDDLKRFFSLPVDREPDYVFAVCDTAEGGGDYVSFPVAYIYGEDVFIADVVYDDATPEVTKPEVAKMIVKHKIGNCVFESNLAGTYFARDVEELVKKMGGKCSISTSRTITNKKTRIELASDYILKHFYFLDESKYRPNSQYARAMRELTTYTRTGRPLHDDFTDSLGILENKLRSFTGIEIEVVRRLF